MAQFDGFPGVSGATDFDELRKLYAGTVVRDAFGVPRAGVFPFDNSPAITGRTDLKFNVSDLLRWATVRNGGVIFGGTSSVTVVDPPAIGLPSANSRIDILWVKQNIVASPIGDATDGPVFGWTTGTASATPVRPTTALPAGALEIGQVQTAFNTTATNDGTKVTITSSGPLTAMAGGSVPFRTFADLTAWTAAAPRQRATVFADTNAVLNGDYSWSGVRWVPASPLFMKAAIIPISLSGTLQPVGQLVLPANTSWKLDGVIYFDVSVSTAGRYVAQLWNATTNTALVSSDMGPFSGPVAGQAYPVPVTDTIVVGSTAVTLQLRARATGGSGSQGVNTSRLIATMGEVQ